MRVFPFAFRNGYRWLPLLLSFGCLNAQSCLILSRPTVTTDHVAVIELRLYSPVANPLAAVQWTLQDTTSSVTSFSVNDGPQLTGAGKTAMCAGNVDAYICLAVGSNTNIIGNGIIAVVTAALAAGAVMPALQIRNPMAASPEGYFVPIQVFPDCKLPPTRGSRQN